MCVPDDAASFVAMFLQVHSLCHSHRPTAAHCGYQLSLLSSVMVCQPGSFPARISSLAQERKYRLLCYWPFGRRDDEYIIQSTSQQSKTASARQQSAQLTMTCSTEHLGYTKLWIGSVYILYTFKVQPTRYGVTKPCLGSANVRALAAR